jgi:bacterioferritin-associated ferredoxin
MYVCICRAVTEKQVESTLETGATTVAEVTRACGAGGDCGGCVGMIEEMIEERAEDRETRSACAKRHHLPLSPHQAA